MRGLGSLKDWIFLVWKAEDSLDEEEEMVLRAAEAEETVAIAEQFVGSSGQKRRLK